MKNSTTYLDVRGVPHDEVEHAASCTCRVAEHAWPDTEPNRDAIDRHWAKAKAANPGYFDGIILLTAGYALERRDDAHHLELTLFETRFRNYLYWRHSGFPTGGPIDGFGSAIIRSAEGGVLLIRQSLGNVNAGLCYFPSGFIDRSDRTAGGRVDIAASIEREVTEELGLQLAQMQRVPGFIVTRAGPHLSVGVEYRSDQDARALLQEAHTFLSAENSPEVADVHIVHRLHDMEGLKLAPHAAVLLARLLPAG